MQDAVLRTLLRILIPVFLSVLNVAGDDLFVSKHGLDTGSRTNWTSAYTNLQDALDHAANDTVIRVAGQVFALESTLELAAKSGVTIRGGYQAANDDDLPGPHDPNAWPTVLDGQDSQRVILVSAATNCRIEHVTITGGNIPDSFGSGVYVLDSSGLTLAYCMITGNYGGLSASGGGIAIASSSSVIISNSTIRDNDIQLSGSTIQRRGGGVHLASGSSLMLADSVLKYNRL